jgi:hypothetical protein
LKTPQQLEENISTFMFDLYPSMCNHIVSNFFLILPTSTSKLNCYLQFSALSTFSTSSKLNAILPVIQVVSSQLFQQSATFFFYAKYSSSEEKETNCCNSHMEAAKIVRNCSLLLQATSASLGLMCLTISQQ